MSPREERSELLTLEPLLDAVRQGIEAAGWTLSGLQKTTSHEFTGRWAGDSTRSAYLFFHREGLPDDVSVDAFLDETSRGLRGNVALVLKGPDLEEIPEVGTFIAELGRVAAGRLPEAFRAPLSVRFSVADVHDAAEAASEVRFKVRLPASAIRAGGSAVHALCETLVGDFEGLLRHEELAGLLKRGDGG